MNDMSQIQSISLQDAHKFLSEKDAVVIDIRDIDTFYQGHIPGAIHLERESFHRFLHEADKSLTYIVCCYRGNSSKQVAAILNEQGFASVYNLEGGFMAWKDAADQYGIYEVEFDA